MCVRSVGRRTGSASVVDGVCLGREAHGSGSALLGRSQSGAEVRSPTYLLSIVTTAVSPAEAPERAPRSWALELSGWRQWRPPLHTLPRSRLRWRRAVHVRLRGESAATEVSGPRPCCLTTPPPPPPVGTPGSPTDPQHFRGFCWAVAGHQLPSTSP